MTPKVAHFLNRTILVSIPSLFEDGEARPFKLLDIEAQGLWLQSDEATARLLTNEMQAYAATAPAIFVPFAQIAAVLAPTQIPAAVLSHIRMASDAPKQPAASRVPKQRAPSGAPKQPADSGAPKHSPASEAPKRPTASGAPKKPATSSAPERRASSGAPKHSPASGASNQRAASGGRKRRTASGAPKRKAK